MFTDKIIKRISNGLDRYKSISRREKNEILAWYKGETLSEVKWKVIPGYDGFYEISNYGAVRSWKNTRGNKLDKPKMLKPSIGTHGYLVYGLFKNNKTTGNGCLHRLFANAFVPNPENLPVINHDNGIKLDNRPENIEWCSYKRNINHAFENGLSVNKGLKGEDHNMSKLTKKEVIEIREEAKKGTWGIQRKLADEFGVTEHAISAIVNRKSWKHI